MSRPKYGTARDAVRLLTDIGYGISGISQFDVLRAASTLLYDPITRVSKPLPPREDQVEIYIAEVGPVPSRRTRRDPVREHFYRTRHLICPAFSGERLPGGRWRYNLTALRQRLAQGCSASE